MAQQWLPDRCPRCGGSVLVERDVLTGDVESLCLGCSQRVTLGRPRRWPDLTWMPEWMRAAAGN